MSWLTILSFARRNWQAIAAAALLAALYAWHAGRVSVARAEGDSAGRAAVQAEWDQERAALSAAADQANLENQARKDAQHAAVNTARDTRADTTARDNAALARLAGERDGLRRDLATALDTIRSSCDLPGPAAAAAAERAAAVEAVLADLERAGADMARAAAGHAADSLMYQQAWPK